MPALSNQKHERFAQAMSLEGAEQRKAYLDAGFNATPKGADANASKLMRRPDVKARILELRTKRVEGLVREVQEVVGPLDKELFSRVGRAKKLVNVVRRIEAVIDARAAAKEHQDIPGGNTGIVVLKGVKKDGTKISAVDTKLLAEMRSNFEQIARELGQWVEKRDDTLEIRHLADLSDETLDEIIAAAKEIEEREAKLKAMQPKPIELTRVDPGDEEPTGAGDPVVEYRQP